MWWLVGDQEFFQLEIFQHTNPKQRPLPADWRPSDHGWVRFGVEVADFDFALAAIERQGVCLMSAVHTKRGLRRAAFRDPFIGIIVEIMERVRAAPGSGPRVVYVTSSVSDLKTARDFYEETLGFVIHPLEHLHTADDETLWGLDGARRDGFLVETGDVLLEILQYRHPLGRPKRDDYLISDQGIMNIAMGSRDKADIEAVLKRIHDAGYAPPFTYNQGGTICGYIVAPEREIEFTSVPKEFDALFGFQPTTDFMR